MKMCEEGGQATMSGRGVKLDAGEIRRIKKSAFGAAKVKGKP